MEEKEGNDGKISKFSSGLNIVMRLDELWKDTHKHSRAGLYNKWNLDLDRIWLELARDLKDKFETEETKFKAFDTKLEALGNISDKEPAGFKELTEIQIKNRDKYYKLMMEKQIFLARLENQLGKGTTFEEGDDDDFD